MKIGYPYQELNTDAIQRHSLLKLKWIFLIVLQTALPFGSRSQSGKPLNDITAMVDQPREHLGVNKAMPTKFEKQILAALRYFPELQKTKIHFKIRSGWGGLSARPSWASLFRRSRNRRYIVMIGDSTKTAHPKVLFSNAGLNAQVGILGHELSHVLYFSRKSSWGLFGTGLGHLSKSHMDMFENKTDSVCIEQGLGYQLLAWSTLLRDAAVKPATKNVNPTGRKRHERYMTPASIQRVMRNSKVYQN